MGQSYNIKALAILNWRWILAFLAVHLLGLAGFLYSYFGSRNTCTDSLSVDDTCAPMYSNLQTDNIVTNLDLLSMCDVTSSITTYNSRYYHYEKFTFNAITYELSYTWSETLSPSAVTNYAVSDFIKPVPSSSLNPDKGHFVITFDASKAFNMTIYVSGNTFEYCDKTGSWITSDGGQTFSQTGTYSEPDGHCPGNSYALYDTGFGTTSKCFFSKYQAAVDGVFSNYVATGVYNCHVCNTALVAVSNGFGFYSTITGVLSLVFVIIKWRWDASDEAVAGIPNIVAEAVGIEMRQP